MIKRLRIYSRHAFIAITVLGGLSLIVAFDKQDKHASEPDPACLDNLEIPREFSPEADTLNRFAIPFPCEPETFAIQVYHPNGDRVYFSQDYQFSWDGNNMDNEPCETQVYSWKLNYKYNMQNAILKGGLLLLR